MLTPKALAETLRGALARVPLPTLGKEVELPVYLIHNSPDAEDYFFIFDFEEFVEQTRAGWFVRPKLKVWAGRADFGRRPFARQFRESFAREFDIARTQLMARDEKPKGWFGFLASTLGELREASLSSVVANVVLLVALTAGSKVLAQILPTGWLTQKSDAAKLEEGIADTKSKVDAALENIEITLHMELLRHAFQDGAAERLTGLDYDAWPLPAYVREHLTDGVSGAWW